MLDKAILTLWSHVHHSVIRYRFSEIPPVAVWCTTPGRNVNAWLVFSGYLSQ